ncbi:hypothetical protein CEY16_01040 [Halalkalibacillus sediminis]|uniref:DZANK-type domain-containing protein n=1 Tax=Halalkalibacillus sediminis TaxID=2018042 RepID=A0A2I0QVK2_9BACI|nr:zinc ribbon domain-containing protein [Halalkalibacillus sediminis]PKR78373.1 hypothetical protein CEY16_01040 [Halalkalibacillus sediminis]
MIYCTKCGKGNADQANYCINDGAALHSYEHLPQIDESSLLDCKNCGTELHETANYCHYCGQSLEKITSPEMKVNRPLAKFEKLTPSMVLQSFVKTFPVAIITLLTLFFVSQLFISETDIESSFDQNINEFTIIDQHDRTLQEVEHFKYYTMYGFDNMGMTDTSQIYKPSDIILSSFMVSSEYKIEDSNVLYGSDSSMPETERRTEFNLGFLYHFMIFIVILALILFVLSKIQKRTSRLTPIIAGSITYGMWMALGALIIAYLAQTSSYDGNNTTIYFSYPLFEVIWKSLLLSGGSYLLLKLIFSKLPLHPWLQSIVEGARIAITLFITLVFISTVMFLVVQSRSETFSSLIESTSLINGLAVIIQIAVVLLNLIIFNTFGYENYYSNSFIDAKYSLMNQVIEKVQEGPFMEVTDFYFDPISQIENVIWIVFGLSIILLLVHSRKFVRLSLKSKITAITLYSLIFSTIVGVFSYGATFVVERSNFGDNANQMIGFDLSASLFYSFIFVWVITFVGSYLIATFKNNTSMD